MDQMKNDNIALLVPRHLSGDFFRHVFVTNIISEMCVVSTATKEQNYHYPLYKYSDEGKKFPNINIGIVNEIMKKTGQNYFENEDASTPDDSLTPNRIFNYTIAILHSKSYRERYLDSLKSDFPHIPFTSNKKLFIELYRLGENLVSLYLMKSKKFEDFITSFVGHGDNIVESIGNKSYRDGRLYINQEQYFEGVPEDVYNFHIGAYQVCQKWLKDRKGRQLSEEEIVHYQRIMVAINETIKIMKEIDNVIEEHGGWPIR